MLCSDRLFTLSSFGKLEVTRQTNKRARKRVNSHKNAKLAPRGRKEIVRRMDSMPAAAVAAGFGVSLRTARKWKSRYRQGGVEALADKSSRPMRCRSRLTEKTFGEIFSLRQKRLTGDAIAARLGLGRSSVFRALRKLGRSHLASLEVKPRCGVTSGKSPANVAYRHQATGEDRRCGTPKSGNTSSLSSPSRLGISACLH